RAGGDGGLDALAHAGVRAEEEPARARQSGLGGWLRRREPAFDHRRLHDDRLLAGPACSAGVRHACTLLHSRSCLGLDDLPPERGSTLAAPTHGPGLSERKTGVKHAEVVTGRLVRDDRGWLPLAG